MALDVKRFLADEVILARPPSKLYRFQKILLRNKLLFAGLGMIAALLIASLIVVSASLAGERKARQDADSDKQKAQQATKFLEEMLQGVGPAVALGQDTRMLKGILDRTAERVGKEMTNQPAVEAHLRNLIGTLYQRIGNYRQAEEMHRAALTIRRRLSGSESAETAESLNNLGVVLMAERKLPDAEAVVGEALAIRRQLFGNENADTATSLNDLGAVYRDQGRLTEAEAMAREALGIRRKLLGAEHLDVADSLRNLCIILGNEGKWLEAEAMGRDVLAMRRKLLGPEHPWVASALSDIAWAAGSGGKKDEAEALDREALAMRQKLLPESHPDLARSFYLVGDRMRQQGNLNEAHTVSVATLLMQRKVLGEDNPALLDTMLSLGLTLEAEGKLTESEAVQREALALWRKLGENETPQALSALEHLARFLIVQKKFDGAEQLLDEALTPAFTLQPSSVNLLDLRVDLRGRRGEWQEAAADALIAFEHQPRNSDRFAPLAALLIKSKNQIAYEQLCQRLQAGFANATNIFVADQVAKACLLRPDSKVDLPMVGRLADSAVTRGIGDTGAMPFFQIGKALSEYRQSRFAGACEWAQRTIASPRQEAHGQAYAVLAMAQWQLGLKEEAQATLAKGDIAAPPIMPTRIFEDAGNAWLAWLFSRVSLDEAAALIQPSSINDGEPNKP
jgi:tetratricopeptide (TPR) repeat protein